VEGYFFQETKEQSFRMAEDLSRMWDSFSLKDDEDGEMEIQQQAWEVGTLRGKSCVVGKLIADRMMSKEIIRTQLIRGWKPEGTPSFKILGDNLFLVELETEKDKIRILDGRPWSVEGHLFAVEDYDGLSSPSNYRFEKAAFWVRINGLPLSCMSLVVGNQIGSAMGQVLEVDVDDGGMGWGECLRVKVLLDLQKPLLRGRKLKINGSSILITFQYEKLPKFCFRCGAIMHGGTGCPERHDVRAQNATVQYGPWMRASSPTRKIGGPCAKATSPVRKAEKNYGKPMNRRGGATHDYYTPANRPEYGRKSHNPSSGEDEMESQSNHKGKGINHGHQERGRETSMERNRGHQYFPPNGNSNAAESAEETLGANMGGKNMGTENLGAENQEGLMGGNSGVRDQAQGNEHTSSADIFATDLTGMERKLFSGKAGVNKRGSEPTAVRAFFEELERNTQAGREPENGKGVKRALSEGGVGLGTKETKRAHGFENFYTVAEVEKKIKKTLFTEQSTSSRASDEVGRKLNKMGNPKSMVGERVENQGKRKIREFNGTEEEVMKKRSTNNGRVYKPKNTVTKNDKNGSGMAEAVFQPRRPQ
jgi:hypothetical protein